MGTTADPCFTTATGLPLFGVSLTRLVMLLSCITGGGVSTQAVSRRSEARKMGDCGPRPDFKSGISDAGWKRAAPWGENRSHAPASHGEVLRGVSNAGEAAGVVGREDRGVSRYCLLVGGKCVTYDFHLHG